MQLTVVGPTYPFRGGIAHHTTLMVRALRQRHQVSFYSFTSQYPRWLFPGRTDQDPSQSPLREPCQYVLSPLNPASWLRTAGRIRADRPEGLIIPWWVPFWAPAWAALARLARPGRSTKVVFVCHNVLPHEPSRWDRPLARLALSAGDRFVVHTEQDAEHLRQLLPRARPRVTPLPTYQPVGGAAQDTTSARLALGLDPSQHVLLFFGFVRPYKGLDVLLDALPAVDPQLAIHLLVVGEIWGDPSVYWSQIERLGLSSRVTLVNQYVTNDELGQFFSAADAVVLPYRTATQSAVTQLAFGFGKPVITTSVGGLAEAVIDGVSGLIVPPESPPALAEAIDRFYQQGLRARLEAGVLAQAERFSWERLVKVLESLVE